MTTKRDHRMHPESVKQLRALWELHGTDALHRQMQVFYEEEKAKIREWENALGGKRDKQR